MKTLKGICPIIAAPFTNSGELDLDSLKNLLRVLARGGCDALTLFGIAGTNEDSEQFGITQRRCPFQK